jgi:hypothetical protein
MERLIKNILRIALLFVSDLAYGQADVQMADGMRAEGKIYVVVGIILIVLTGLVVYLVILDRKGQKARKSPGRKKFAAKMKIFGCPPKLLAKAD